MMPAMFEDFQPRTGPSGPQFPERIGPYRLIEVLGRGGMATVYRAVCPQRGPVALKLYSEDYDPDPELRGRFRREMAILAELDHPHIVKIHDMRLDADRRICFAMELAEGGTLRQALDRADAPAGKVIEDLLGVLGALGYLHARDVVHRDLTPRNLLYGEGGRLKLSDFGLARDLCSSMTTYTRSGEAVGTPYYMSPEQAEGKPVGAESDLFGFGVILYETVTGRVPFAGQGVVQVTQAIARGRHEPPSAHGADRGLDGLVARCLHGKPERRYRRAADLAHDLEVYMGRRPGPARWREAARARLRRRAALAMLAAPLVVWLAWQWSRRDAIEGLPAVEELREIASVMWREGEEMLRKARIAARRARREKRRRDEERLRDEGDLQALARGELPPRLTEGGGFAAALKRVGKLQHAARLRLVLAIFRLDPGKRGPFIDALPEVPEKELDALRAAWSRDPQRRKEIKAAARTWNRQELANPGNHAAALEAYGREVRTDPLELAGYSNRAFFGLQGFGRYREALADYRIAIRLAPKHPPPYNNRAWLWLDARRFAAAEADWTMALKYEKDKGWILKTRLFLAVAQAAGGRLEAARSDWKALPAAYLRQVVARATIALGLLMAGRPAEARERLGGVERDNVTHHVRGVLRLGAADAAGAAADLRRALQLGPSTIPAHKRFALGRALLALGGLGQATEARAHFQAVRAMCAGAGNPGALWDGKKIEHWIARGEKSSGGKKRR